MQHSVRIYNTLNATRKIFGSLTRLWSLSSPPSLFPPLRPPGASALPGAAGPGGGPRGTGALRPLFVVGPLAQKRTSGRRRMRQVQNHVYLPGGGPRGGGGPAVRRFVGELLSCDMPAVRSNGNITSTSNQRAGQAGRAGRFTLASRTCFVQKRCTDGLVSISFKYIVWLLSSSAIDPGQVVWQGPGW